VYSFQFDTSGNLKVTGGGGGGSNVTIVGQTVTLLTEDAADGIVGSPVGTDAIQIGFADGSGNLQIPSATNPLPVTITNTNVPTNIAQWGGVATSLGSKVSASSVPVVIASDQGSISVTIANADVPANIAQWGGTNTTLGQKAMAASVPIVIASDQSNVPENMVQWGGTSVTAPPATTVPAAGTEVAPVVKPIQRKATTLLNPASIGSSATYNSTWIDTQATGVNFVFCAFIIPSTGFTSNAFKIQESDDQTNILTAAQVTPVVATLGSVFAPIASRYYRIQFVNGTTVQTSPTITVDEFSVPPISVIAGSAGLTAVQNPVGYLVVTNVGGNALTDAITASYQVGASNGANVQGVVGMGVTSASGAATVMNRVPAMFRSALVNSGTTLVWGPSGSKKPRLMKYRIDVGEDCSYASANTPVMIDFVYGTLAPTGQPYGPLAPILTHRVQVPTTALATAGVLYSSGWIDLGNGPIVQFSNQPWYVALSIAQSTGASTGTWTITSNQWEAIAFGFKSIGGLGGARLRSTVQASGVASAVIAAQNFAAGSNLIALVRTTNIAAGAPTVTVTDSQGVATWTSGAQVTNATDGTNGSSLQIFWTTAPLATGFTSNTVTATTTVHAATLTEIIVLEVFGLIATTPGDAAQVSATGNSAAPSAGAYTPATAGDYIILVYASSANIAAAPIMATSTYLARNYIASASGTMGFADNLGNGTLAAGGVSVMMIGTEE
jgi:hypothetical protein